MIIAKAPINLHMAVCSQSAPSVLKIHEDSNQSAHSDSLIGLYASLTTAESSDINITHKLPSEYFYQSARVRMPL